jgi:prepilin-type N-terminal cleavage/methylation domain-containing protein/prepilin-type processing-associated H-X9-DG protein
MRIRNPLVSMGRVVSMSIAKPSTPAAVRQPCQRTQSPGRRGCDPTRAHAFTLIEVLVVVAIIALIISILIPALKQAREQATGAVCISNMRQIVMGMHAYTSEAGRLPGNNSVFWLAWDRSGRPGGQWPTWKAGDSWLGMRDPEHAFTTAEQQQLWDFIDQRDPVRGSAYLPNGGSLYKFVKNEQVYLCSKDHRGMPTNEITGGGGNGRFSYTMNGWLGFKSPESVQAFTYVANFETKGGALPPPVAQIPNGTTVKWPPARMPLLIEEGPWNNANHGWVGDSWAADTYLVLRHYPRPTTGRAPFGFLDGHVEFKMYKYFIPGPGSVPNSSILQGVDLFNEYRLPYSYAGNAGGPENEEAFAHKFRYPYND